MPAVASADVRGRASGFLAALPHNEGWIDARDVAVVVAHPDDETIGCGAQLKRWRGASIVVVTDGAPRNLKDARRYGFATATEYAGVRAAELAAALQISDVSRSCLRMLGVPDQQAAFRLPHIVASLAEFLLVNEIRVAVTHAYEGGHPDHDATALAVHAAARQLRRAGSDLGIIEMPFYRLGRTGLVRQRFSTASGDGGEVAVNLTDAQQQHKRRMMAAHASQWHLLAPFAVDAERFRPAPTYDFAQLPNAGRLLYEHYDWGLDGAQWRKLAGSALASTWLGAGGC